MRPLDRKLLRDLLHLRGQMIAVAHSEDSTRPAGVGGAMKIHVHHLALFRTELETRLPFRYGIATMTRAPIRLLPSCARMYSKPKT